MKKRFAISVIDFAIPAPKAGSIDIYSGFSQGQTAGVELHREIQQTKQKQDPSYHSEVWTMHTIKFKKYIFDVAGRIDGVYRKEKTKIEEIKTAFDLKKLTRFLENAHYEHPYWLQLQSYGYFHWQKTNEIPELSLYLVSQRNKKIVELPFSLNISAYEEWLNNRLFDLAEEIKKSEQRIKRRKKTAESLIFPFDNPRPSQKELIETVKSGMISKSSLLIQAPTGLGKTIGILFPALQEALTRGQKVIYVTPKNSQHQVAFEAINKLQQRGCNTSSLTITAKKKLCFKAEQLCNSEYCEFAENHYSKVTEHKLLEKIKKKKNLVNSHFQDFGKTYKVCPYELQMDSIPFVDVVICDYNYVFALTASGNRVGKLALGETAKPNLVIDEIHNLPARGMDYYSPMLAVNILEKMRFEINRIPAKFHEQMDALLQECIQLVRACKLPNIHRSHIITISADTFKQQEFKLKEFLSIYLESDITISENDVVLTLCNYWMEFTAALEFVQEAGDEFFISYIADPEGIKITCCDASKMLSTCYSNYEQVIGFSATLKPFNYYSQLIGLHTSNLATSEFLSPFPTHRRKILIIPQISSKYSERSRHYSRIVETIKKITELKLGNYFIFFPSFEFLEKVAGYFKSSTSFKILRQQAGMKHQQINEFLTQLHNENNHHLIFAVQGGIFSEGVDYPGHLAIGAFVVGPPLPIFDWEREQMRKYYQKQYSAGFDYAYIYPAMAKAVQAAGRVIRSETDKGIIILIDDRFLQENYSKCMPRDWFEENPKELVSQAILRDLKEFWDN